jgi:hypothetical protein
MQDKPIIDAEFEVVDGPYRVGDEHREKRGWYLTDLIGKHGEQLWFKPPNQTWARIKKWMIIGFWTMCALAGVFAAVMESL